MQNPRQNPAKPTRACVIHQKKSIITETSQGYNINANTSGRQRPKIRIEIKEKPFHLIHYNSVVSHYLELLGHESNNVTSVKLTSFALSGLYQPLFFSVV